MKIIIASIVFAFGVGAGVALTVIAHPDTSALALAVGIGIGILAGVPTALSVRRSPGVYIGRQYLHIAHPEIQARTYSVDVPRIEDGQIW